MNKIIDETTNENNSKNGFVNHQFVKIDEESLASKTSQINENSPVLTSETERKQIKTKGTYKMIVLFVFFLVFGIAICFSLNKYYSKNNLNITSPTPTENIQPTPTTIYENVFITASPKPTEKTIVSPTIKSCLKYPTLVAKGLVKILVVPVYFSDVKDEIINHEKRVIVYDEAFKEINLYLNKIQQEKMGKIILNLKFELSKPIVTTQPPTYFELSSANIKAEIKSQLPEIVLDNYQIIIFRALTNMHTNTNGYNLGGVIWINRDWGADAPIPEKIEFIENNNQYALHLYRGILTSLTLHEILHNFGMSDGEGARVNIFFTGNIYDGTQKMFYIDLGSDLRNVDSNTGIFQDIGPNVSKEIGWSDANNNGILDVEEFCGM